MRHDDEDFDLDAVDVARIRGILAELGDSDFELLDPPAAIWEGIEASVTSMPARRPPARTTPSPLVVEYVIDAGDVLTDVGAGWAEFANANGAPELAGPASDRVLWTYFDQPEITEMWQLLVHRVRILQRGARVPFRCDAPHARRWFEMTVSPAPEGSVHFRSALVFEETRPPVALLDPLAPRDAEAQPVPLCSWCGRGQHGARWFDIEELLRAGRLLERVSMPPISHGICGACRDEMAAEVLVPDRAGNRPA
jgi:hypothetical protein